MMTRLLEQKKAILMVTGDVQIPALYSNYWNIITNIVDILQIFDMSTLSLSTRQVTISETIL